MYRVNRNFIFIATFLCCSCTIKKQDVKKEVDHSIKLVISKHLSNELGNSYKPIEYNYVTNEFVINLDSVKYWLKIIENKSKYFVKSYDRFIDSIKYEENRDNIMEAYKGIDYVINTDSIELYFNNPYGFGLINTLKYDNSFSIDETFPTQVKSLEMIHNEILEDIHKIILFIKKYGLEYDSNLKSILRNEVLVYHKYFDSSNGNSASLKEIVYNRGDKVFIKIN